MEAPEEKDPRGDTEERDKAGVDRRLFQNCSATASPGPLPLRLPAMILTGAGWLLQPSAGGRPAGAGERGDGHLSVYKL